MDRVTTGIKIHGTKSFRLSCSKLLGVFGVNLQNPPEELLQCLRPSKPDYSFVQVDQSGAESLIVAYESGGGMYLELAEKGIKPHIYVALHLFIDIFRKNNPKERYWSKPPEELMALPEWKELNKEIKNSGKYYQLGKMTNHARSYRMSWPTFQLNVLTETGIALTAAEAKRFLETWDFLFPEVIRWQNEIELRVRNTRMLRNLFNYPRGFYQRLTDDVIREAISWIPQSTVACITHKAYINLFNYIETNNLPWRLLGQKHDSYYIECPDSDVEVARKKMEEFINIELTSTKGLKFRMKSESVFGKNLGKKSESNPEGLHE